ncbi:MAG: transposase, partial [Alphaproteobacteria bacterium]|nr:transposase [Alphaproteobacteria bacterium]
LDACFHAACSDKPWRELPAVFGKWQTIHRLFVRWTHKRGWEQLLKFVASRHNKVSPAIVWWVCKAFRRARRIMGIKGYMLARRLGMDSALPASSWFLPDPVVMRFAEEIWRPRMVAVIELQGRWPEKGAYVQVMRRLLNLAGGKRCVSAWMAPELMFPGMHGVPCTANVL